MTFFRKKKPPRIARDVPGKMAEPRPGDSKMHLAFIRNMKCLCCDVPRSDPHHLRSIAPYGNVGMGEKAPDMWCIPLCREHHDGIHDVGTKNQDAYLATFGQRKATSLAIHFAQRSPDMSVREAMREAVYEKVKS